ncbi:hypothetical protein ACLB2K_045679 [Fragaria x ananassa]
MLSQTLTCTTDYDTYNKLLAIRRSCPNDIVLEEVWEHARQAQEEGRDAKEETQQAREQARVAHEKIFDYERRQEGQQPEVDG